MATSGGPWELVFRKKKKLPAGLNSPIVSLPPPPVPATIVKFAFDTSKKTFPTASTFTRAVVVALLGTTISSDPSLGVLDAITMGNVVPPFVESEIFTFAQLTGAAVVFATFHVTV
jgi:hypothetical protein